MVSNCVNKLPRQRRDPAEPLQKIQRDAFPLQNRARKAAHFDDRRARTNSVAINTSDVDVRRRIDLSKYLSGGPGTGDDRILASNNSSECMQRLRNEKATGDITIANVFLQRGGNRVVTVELHARMRNTDDTSEIRVGLYRVQKHQQSMAKSHAKRRSDQGDC